MNKSEEFTLCRVFWITVSSFLWIIDRMFHVERLIHGRFQHRDLLFHFSSLLMNEPTDEKDMSVISCVSLVVFFLSFDNLETLWGGAMILGDSVDFLGLGASFFDVFVDFLEGGTSFSLSSTNYSLPHLFLLFL